MESKKNFEKDYRKRSPQFFTIGLVVALSCTLVAFEWRTVHFQSLAPISMDQMNFAEEEEPIYIIRPAAPKIPEPVAPSPVIPVDPNPIIIGPEPVPIEPAPPVAPIGFEPEPIVPEIIPLVRIAEKMPEFVGGEKALYAFLSENVRYPKMALENNVEGKVFVEFIVNSDGTISDVKVLRPAGFGMDEEAKRVIKSMPKWIPGKQGGKEVRVMYVIPINFSLM